MNKSRKLLIDEMVELEQQGKNCASCTGVCCTFKKNSMRITPLEAVEIFLNLEQEKKWTPELVKKITNNIKEFRLDSTLMVGTRHTFRRTYTCPFFKHESLGCSLTLRVKPYGCLAFNAMSVGVKEGENCESNLDLLKRREHATEDVELKLNAKIKESLRLHWDKESIPVALLDIAKHKHLLENIHLDY